MLVFQIRLQEEKYFLHYWCVRKYGGSMVKATGPIKEPEQF